jgi:hypothetical protein
VKALIDSIGPIANPNVKTEFSKRLEARVKTKLDSELNTAQEIIPPDLREKPYRPVN